MNKLEFVKTGIGFVTSLGVGAIVGNAIKATTPSNMKNLTKICVAIGSFVLTALAGDMASKYTEEQIDSAVDTVKDLIKGDNQVVGETEA